MTFTPSPLFTSDQAGSYLHLNARTLANWRVLGKGPRYVRSGSRPLYRQCDLDAWLESHTFAHTAEERMRRASQVAAINAARIAGKSNDAVRALVTRLEAQRSEDHV